MNTRLIALLGCVVAASVPNFLRGQDESSSESTVPILDWPIETVSTDHGFTEGPAIGPDGGVYFSDIDNNKILKFDPDSGITEVWNENSRKSNGLLVVGNTMYACEAAGRVVSKYDLRKGPESREVIVDRFDGKRFGSPNDLAVIGNDLVFSSFFWKGVLAEDDKEREIHENRTYVANLKSGKVRALPHKFQTPNGVLYDPNSKALYLAEMKESKVYKAKVAKGVIGETELFFDLETIDKGKPDGMTVDPHGRLYIALYGKSDQLLILNPDASVVGVLPTGWRTSNCTISEDGKTLYITADHKLKRVQIPLNAEKPQAMSEPNSPEATLREYERRLSQQSWNVIEDLIHDDAVFIFTEATFRGKDAIQGTFEKTFDLIKEEKYWLTELNWVAKTNEMASCEYLYHWEGIIHGNPSSGGGRGSAVLIKTDAGWKIVQEHLGPAARG